jgi:hypothetical protein
MPVNRNKIHEDQANAVANRAAPLFVSIDATLSREYDHKQPHKKIRWEDRRGGDSSFASKVDDEVAEHIKRVYGAQNWDVTYEQYPGNPYPRSNMDDYGPYTTFYFTSPPVDPRG